MATIILEGVSQRSSIPNAAIFDPRLSWGGRGLLAWLLATATAGGGRPVSTTQLDDAPDLAIVRGLLDELAAAGYLQRVSIINEQGEPAGYEFILLEKASSMPLELSRTTKAAPAKACAPAPPGVDPETWSEWMAVRAERKFPRYTAGSVGYKLVCRKLAELAARGQDPSACVRQSAECGYRGVFEIVSARANLFDAANGQAKQAWTRLHKTVQEYPGHGEIDMDPRTAAAVDAIGGVQRLLNARSTDVPFIQREFIVAWLNAPEHQSS